MAKEKSWIEKMSENPKGGKSWAIIGIVLAIFFFILGTFYGPDIYNVFHGKKGIIASPSEIEYLCLHKTMKKSISLTNYEDYPIEDYTLAFSWSIEENVTAEVDSIENFQKEKILSMTFDYGNTKNQAFIIPSIEPQEVLSIEFLVSSNCQKNFKIRVAESPVIIDEFFAN